MLPLTRDFIIPAADLRVNYHSVLADAGYKNEESAAGFLPSVVKLAAEINDCLNVSAGFKFFTPGQTEVTKDTIIIDGVPLPIGKVLAGQLRQSEAAALFVATIGQGFNAWQNGVFENDPAEGFFADLMGSAAAEGAAMWIECKIREYAAIYSLGTTNRYSPGYCGWDVSGQQELFRLLPENFCGIELTESSLMLPKKSVSGIIGIGKNAAVKEYQCSLCDMEYCYKRR